MYFPDTMEEVLGLFFFSYFYWHNEIRQKTSFTVYSKVLLSSNTGKRASGKLITENNEEKLELVAYWASSLQEICDKRERGKSLYVHII